MAKASLKFLSLWAINDRLELQALTDQLDELRASGLDGVIFHPRFYPNVPVYMSKEYLDIVSKVILYAKSIDMTFWIYDENGWPSGTAGGQVIARNPELQCHWIEMKPARDASPDTERLSVWNEPDGAEYAVGLHSKYSVSSLDMSATALFIELTHEAYRTGLDPQAFEYITGFFSDEVAFLDGHSVSFQSGGIPWSERFPQQYQERYGEELLPKLPLLFVEDEGSSLIRTQYWEMLTDALIDGFYKPIGTWCEANGKLFTAHLKAEENPFFQLIYSGSGFQVLRDVTLPAIDALERFPGNDFYPRMAHSISVQQGRSGTLVEAMGGAGWGVTPESFTNYVLWLASHGIDHFIMHLNQLRLKMHAVHDWPPSIPCHLTWKEAFPSILQDIKQKAASLPDLRSADPELLIVAPTRGVMGAFMPHEAMCINEHDGSHVPDTRSGRISNQFIELVQQCHAAGIHYEFTEERVLEENAAISSGKVQIGSRVYSKVLIADGCLWNSDSDSSSTNMKAQLKEAGVEVVYPHNWQAVFAVKLNEAEVKATEGKILLGAGGQQSVQVFEQSPWIVEAPEVNQYLIELKPSANGKLLGEVQVEHAVKLLNDGLTLVLLDPMQSVYLNGRLLEGSESHGEYVYALSADSLHDGSRQLVEIEPYEHVEPDQIAFLRGRFAVQSLSPYLEKDERQWMTEGPFIITQPSNLLGDHLIAEGLPFCGVPVKATKQIHVPRVMENAILQLIGIQADAVQVFLDREELGWCWGPNWRIELPYGLAIGTHEISIYAEPSTFNSYGPHRHYEGDRYLTSPAQYKGVKNFTDRPEAPELTFSNDWHFIKWQIKGDIGIVIKTAIGS